jgi:hypothetical protein
MCTRALIAMLVLMSFSAFALAATKDPPCGNNLLEDTDSDGEPDYAYVDDWDCDGILEMEEDIQAAIEALTDTGRKTVRVGPGDYLSPPSAVNPAAIIELPNGMTFEGSGAGITILHGFSSTNVTSPQAVIANKNFVFGNSNITIRDLEIDGGWGSGDASFGAYYRMGVYLNKCINCRVERLTVRDTLHSCLYSKNGNGIFFDDNTLLRCGNYSGTGPTYSCVYLFAEADHTQENVEVTNNHCNGSGASALNSRRGNAAAVLTNILFSGNSVENTRVDGEAANCINVRGITSASYINNTCTNTGPLNFALASDYHSGMTDVAASADILIDGLQLTDLGPDSHGIRILGYLENTTLRNIQVANVPAGRDCLLYSNPLRNVVFEDIELSGCGRWGISENGTSGSGATPDEGLTFRYVTVQGSGSTGVRFAGPVRHLDISGMTVEDSGADGIFWGSPLEQSVVSGLTVIDPVGNGLLIPPGSVDVELTGLNVQGAAQHGLFLSGDGGDADHVNVAIRNSAFSDITKAGIMATQSSTTLDGLTVGNNQFNIIGRTAIDLTLSTSQASSSVAITGNDVRNFGREATAGADRRGIDLTGAVSGVDISGNTIEDVAHQAQYGIVHNVTPTPEMLGYLCSNECTGTLDSDNCFYVLGAVDDFQSDPDSDAIVDYCDGCPTDPDNDIDNDGVCGDVDNCPETINPGQEDEDSDGLGSMCDNCPGHVNPLQEDLDSDDAGDLCDNCLFDYNPAQSDADLDSDGDRCDLDDGIVYMLLPHAERTEWQEEAGFDSWNLYRGDLDVLKELHLYTQEPLSNELALRSCGLTVSWQDDTDPVANGKTAFYLVTGIDGGVESDLGRDGAGDTRPNDNPCP